MEKFNKSNHLQVENSLFLKQHQAGPINWYPYGPVPLDRATKEKKPIFLSIGHSTDYLSKLMREESFCDHQISSFLNEHFICILIDKDEFPDIEQYFRMVSQILNSTSTLPLNVFLTEKMEPFYCASYLPNTSSNGQANFFETMRSLVKRYNDDIKGVSEDVHKINQMLQLPPQIQQRVEFEGHFPSPASILHALKDSQDKGNGGYGKAPKFTFLPFYEFAIEQILEGVVPEEFARHIFESVEKMLLGGVYDHARGGIHKCSLDESWTVPRFEKVLNDQAALLQLLVKTSLCYPSPIVLDALVQTLEYLSVEMLSEDMYFYNAQSSDSEGIQGLYFCYTYNELKEVILSDNELSVMFDKIISWFKVSENGNFHRSLNVICLNYEKREEFLIPENWNIVRKVRNLILQDRKNRIPPQTDPKGVASSNFMIITALCDVVQYSKIDTIKNKASSLLKQTLEKIHSHFIYRDSATDMSRIKTSTTRQHYLPLFEDYVLFAQAQMRIYEISSNNVFFENGIQTMKFIFKEFFRSDSLYTRSIQYDDNCPYLNIHSPLFDHSHKSAVSTYIGLIRKWRLIDNDLREISDKLSKVKDNLTHISLQNPLVFAQAMRALVYPSEVYKKVLIPAEWIKNNLLTNIFPYFSTRFAISYHNDDDLKWEIHNINECELKGVGPKEFMQVFSLPSQSEEEDKK